MSFFKSLFGGGGKTPTAPKAAAVAASAEHKGFKIEATPFREAAQYQLAGVISKRVGDDTKSYRFIRADKFADASEAATRAIDKGRQLIDEQGEALFD